MPKISVRYDPNRKPISSEPAQIIVGSELRGSVALGSDESVSLAEGEVYRVRFTGLSTRKLTVGENARQLVEIGNQRDRTSREKLVLVFWALASLALLTGSVMIFLGSLFGWDLKGPMATTLVIFGGMGLWLLNRRHSPSLLPARILEENEI